MSEEETNKNNNKGYDGFKKENAVQDNNKKYPTMKDEKFQQNEQQEESILQAENSVDKNIYVKDSDELSIKTDNKGTDNEKNSSTKDEKIPEQQYQQQKESFPLAEKSFDEEIYKDSEINELEKESSKVDTNEEFTEIEILSEILTELKDIKNNENDFHANLLYSNSSLLAALNIGFKEIQEIFLTERETNTETVINTPKISQQILDENVINLEQETDNSQIKDSKDGQNEMLTSVSSLIDSNKVLYEASEAKEKKYEILVWPNDFVYSFLDEIPDLIERSQMDEITKKRVIENLNGVEEPEEYFPTLIKFATQDVQLKIVLINFISDTRNFMAMNTTNKIIADIEEEQEQFQINLQIHLIVLFGPTATRPNKPDNILEENFFIGAFEFRRVYNKIQINLDEKKVNGPLFKFIEGIFK